MAESARWGEGTESIRERESDARSTGMPVYMVLPSGRRRKLGDEGKAVLKGKKMVMTLVLT